MTCGLYLTTHIMGRWLSTLNQSYRLFRIMNLPLRAYFLSPLNNNINRKIRDRNRLLSLHNVDVQPTRISDILTTFQTALHNQNRSSLLLLAEALRSDPTRFPLNYDVSTNVSRLSTLCTISFTNPRLDPRADGDFCVYFTLESFGAETLVSDLALFLRTIGRQFLKWSVLGNPRQLNPNNPAHPVLRDIAYCWDGVACAHGVLQFRAPPISLMNIRRAFHRISRICEPFCQSRRYEYLASGVFSDMERAAIPMVFAEVEVAARELCDDNDLFVGDTDHTAHLPS